MRCRKLSWCQQTEGRKRQEVQEVADLEADIRRLVAALVVFPVFGSDKKAHTHLVDWVPGVVVRLAG